VILFVFKLWGKMFNNNTPFIIAEVGQNHQGELDLAKEYIEVFANAGADAIKFQKRDNKSLFSSDAYNQIYNSENAFAETYGEHREKLELKNDWIKILKTHCEKFNVKFMCTPFDFQSLNLLEENDVDAYKIASFDFGNLPLIDRVLKTNKPLVLSTGGANDKHIEETMKVLNKQSTEIALLHCVSEYPCPIDKLNLNMVSKLKTKYPNIIIGLSDHFNGTLTGPLAYMAGARVFEKHVTLNRSWKGSDHGFALEPEGFRKFVRDIKRVPIMFDDKPKNDLGSEPVFMKLGKSITALHEIKKGDMITLENITGKILTHNKIPVRECYKVIGLKTKNTLKPGDALDFDNLE
jgi:sialic acid synthase